MRTEKRATGTMIRNTQYKAKTHVFPTVPTVLSDLPLRHSQGGIGVFYMNASEL